MEETREPLPPRLLRPRAGQAGFFCEKLTAAINHAKDRGDLGTLRQIAGDPHGFILDVILSEAEALRSAVEGSLAISGND